jgi:dienelactone hydrolase
MMKIKKTFGVFLLFCSALILTFSSAANCAMAPASLVRSYLTKPTGEYGVGFQDFDWIKDLNGNCARDDIFSTDQRNYSPNNTKHCHETVVRIYYPSGTQSQLGSFYYQPFIEELQDLLRSQFSSIVTEEQIQQLSDIKSYTSERSSIVTGKGQFPVLLFAPGTDMAAEAYENFITELVSHGYIVAGISTPFLNLTTVYGTQIKPLEDMDEATEALVNSRQQQDLEYVSAQIKALHKEASSPLFVSMDIDHIGAFGHSRGGHIIADLAHKYENSSQKPFQAAVALDIGLLLGEVKSAAFKIPFMHMAAAYQIKPILPGPHIYALGADGYLVGFSSSVQDFDYSEHMNFSDESTLYYAPAIQSVLDYAKQHDIPTGMGTGDGWEMTDAMNIYLLKFFDTYLKNKKDPLFDTCKVLAKNTYFKCGPGVFPN